MVYSFERTKLWAFRCLIVFFVSLLSSASLQAQQASEETENAITATEDVRSSSDTNDQRIRELEAKIKALESLVIGLNEEVASLKDNTSKAIKSSEDRPGANGEGQKNNIGAGLFESLKEYLPEDEDIENAKWVAEEAFRRLFQLVDDYKEKYALKN